MTERSSLRRVLVLGAGGHAKVVVATLQAAGHPICGVLDDDETIWGRYLLGEKVNGPVRRASEYKDAVCILAVGDNSVRHRLADHLEGGVEWGIAVHPSATIHPSVTIGNGTVVFAGAVIQPDTKIGAHAIINTGSTVDHDSVIEDYAHIAPGTHLAGGVRVGEGVLMGIGSVALPGVRIGAWSIVGAGGVVTQHIKERETAIGIPARPMRLSYKTT